MDQKLAMKLYNVMCATENLEKKLEVGKGNNAYKAVGEATVLNMIKPLFKDQKLIIIPKDGDITENVLEHTDSYGKNKVRAVTQLKVYFTIIDAETGESIDIVGFGNGADSQDKGSGKAFTYALKTALNKTFLMFSGEDTDNTHSDDISGEQPKITTDQLIKIAEECGYDSQYLIDKYNRENNKTIDDVKFIKAEVKSQYYTALSNKLKTTK